jgi:nucleoside-diphosphate-sugar epimerase
MPPLRIAVTGGSGKVGRYIIATLVAAGHQVINLDLVDLASTVSPTQAADLIPFLRNVHTVRCDLTDSGQVFSALNTHMRLGEPYAPGDVPRPVDAVVHFAGINKPMVVPDNETFRINVLGSHNVVEAACKLGIKKIIVASSITVYGVSFGLGEVSYANFPVTEEAVTNPTDPYALSKLCAERVAQSYAARFGVDIYCLRIGRVFEPDEYNSDMFWGYVHEPSQWFQHGWSYTDVRDLGAMCLRGLDVSGLEFQVFNAVNDTITNTSEDTAMFLADLYPDVDHLEPFEARQAPISNQKIKSLLGFVEKHDWRQYFTRWTTDS